MSRPTARVYRNRRYLYLYTPLLIVGAVAVVTAFPIINGAYLVGVASLMAGAAGFVRETGLQK